MPAERQEIVLEFVRKVKVILENKLKKAILYGSYARGDYNENSDMDIMLLTTLSNEEIEKTEKKIFDLAFDFQMDCGVDISVVMDKEAQMKRNAMLVYPYIQDDTISHGKAAEMLGIRKNELIEIYGKMNLSYYDSTKEEFEEELLAIKKVRGVAV